MPLNAIINDYIRTYRQHARADLVEFQRLRTLQEVIRHASLCHRLPTDKRHPHQYRIPAAALLMAERKLQEARRGLARAETFEALHDEIERQIRGIHKIGALAVYDITQRIGAFLGLTPAIVYLHQGTLAGARALGFTGKTLDPRSLPSAFSRLKPYEIEDCLCIYKGALRGANHAARPRRQSRCISPSPPSRHAC
jgi:hypothetical protein